MRATATKGHCSIRDTQSQEQQAGAILPKPEEQPTARHGDMQCSPSLRKQKEPKMFNVFILTKAKLWR